MEALPDSGGAQRHGGIVPHNGYSRLLVKQLVDSAPDAYEIRQVGHLDGNGICVFKSGNRDPDFVKFHFSAFQRSKLLFIRNSFFTKRLEAWAPRK
jgi:hypothetical protein